MFFFFNHPATAEISTLSLHDALPICLPVLSVDVPSGLNVDTGEPAGRDAAIEAAVTLTIGAPKEGLLRPAAWPFRSEEHTSELQSHSDLVCRLLLEKKKIITRSRDIR